MWWAEEEAFSQATRTTRCAMKCLGCALDPSRHRFSMQNDPGMSWGFFVCWEIAMGIAWDLGIVWGSHEFEANESLASKV